MIRIEDTDEARSEDQYTDALLEDCLWLNIHWEGCTAEAIENAIAERNKARQEKDWAKADAIRNELLAEGIVLEDKNGLTTWHRQVK